MSKELATGEIPIYLALTREQLGKRIEELQHKYDALVGGLKIMDVYEEGSETMRRSGRRHVSYNDLCALLEDDDE